MTTKKKENPSRRKFVKGMACALASAPCLGKAFALADQAAGKPKENAGERLVAPCGLYCGACPMYLATQEKDDQKIQAIVQQFSGSKMQFKREDLICDGCIAGGRVAAFCRSCALRSCAEAKTNVARCSDCSEYPCSKITAFNNDGMLHHAEVLANLRQMRSVGISEWTRSEENRWSCPQCHAKISWYDKACSKCGTKRSDRLFPLKQA